MRLLDRDQRRRGRQLVAVLAALSATLLLPTSAGAAAAPSHAFVWGDNNRGGLGTAGTARVLEPKAVELPAAVAAVDGGSAHTVAVAAGGTVWAWGDNRFGQLGAVASGDRAGAPVQVPLPEPVSAVAAGADFTLALTASGAVYAWGRNDNGQLGDGVSGNSPNPVRIALPGAATAIAAGGAHGVALLADGSVRSWGAGSSGQLGKGARTSSATPVLVALPTGTVVTAVAAGLRHTVAVDSDGALWQWGESIGDTAAPTSPRSVALPAGTSAAQLVSGDDFALVRTDTGELASWGDNSQGQLGDGSSTDHNSPRVVAVPSGSPVTHLAVGAQHVLAATADGGIWQWGDGDFGQGGDGSTDDRPTPQLIEALAGAEITGLATGAHSALVLVDRGPLAALAVSPASATVNPDVPQAFSASGRDAFGVDLGPVTATLTISGGTCDTTTCRSATPGRHQVTASAGVGAGGTDVRGHAVLLVNEPTSSSTATTPATTTASSVATTATGTGVATIATGVATTSDSGTGASIAVAVARTGGDDSDPAPPGSGALGYTGIAGWLIPLAVILLAVGATLVTLARRRRRPATHTPTDHFSQGDQR